MKKRSFYFIVNPVAGNSKGGHKLKKLLYKLSEKGFINDFAFSEFRGHAFELARSHHFTENEMAVSFGGDGTFNEIASALAGTGTPVAVLPAGSGNGLARTFKIHRLPFLKYLIQSEPVNIDAGIFGDKFFFCTCGIGFDAMVAARFNKGKSRGLINYIYHVVRLYLKYKPAEAEIEIDGNNISGKFFLVTVANAPQYGNDAWVAPNADLNDGLLDVTMVKPFPVIFLPLMVLALFGGFIHRLPWVHVLKGREVVLKKVSNHHFHYDGESMECIWPLKISVVPKAVKILIPPSKS